MAYRVVGEASLAAASAAVLGYVKGVPGMPRYTAKGFGLGVLWCGYYNMLQEMLRAQRDRNDVLNSAVAGATIGFVMGMPYCGPRRAPVMMLQVRRPVLFSPGSLSHFALLLPSPRSLDERSAPSPCAPTCPHCCRSDFSHWAAASLGTSWASGTRSSGP